jgi:predicted cupin superfamily sugar epimerase
MTQLKYLEIARLLGLAPHPEGGYYRETYRSPGTIPADALGGNFNGPRHFSTAIYYLLPAGQFSAFHRIRQDEGWHFYMGEPLTIYELGTGGALTSRILGTELDQGQVPQLMVRAGHWFAASVEGGQGYALAGCTVAPGFDFSDFEMARRDQLTALYPAHADLVRRLTRE